MIPLLVLSLTPEAADLLRQRSNGGTSSAEPPNPIAGETWASYVARVHLTPSGDGAIPTDAHRWDPWGFRWVPPGDAFLAPQWQFCPFPVGAGPQAPQ